MTKGMESINSNIDKLLGGSSTDTDNTSGGNSTNPDDSSGERELFRQIFEKTKPHFDKFVERQN